MILEWKLEQTSVHTYTSTKGVIDTNEALTVNGLLGITPLKSDDQYRYLGIDENILYNGPIKGYQTTMLH